MGHMAMGHNMPPEKPTWVYPHPNDDLLYVVNNGTDNVVEVEFNVISKGKTATAGHYGKAVKGNFIRYLALNQVKSVDDFAGFSYDGFKWDGKSFLKET